MDTADTGSPFAKKPDVRNIRRKVRPDIATFARSRQSDLDCAVNFYRDVFECHVALHESEAALVLTPGGFQIYFRPHETPTRGIDDVGVEQIIWSAGSEAELQRIEQRLRTHYPSTYTNTLNGITFVDGVDPDEHRVLITYPTPEQLPREVIDRRFR